MKIDKSAKRRKLLIAMGVVGSSQLPAAWSKPIVDAIVLPAHAELSQASQSSNTETSAPTEFVGSIDLGVTLNASPIQNILSTVISEANAGNAISSTATICINSSAAPQFSAIIELYFIGYDRPFYFTGQGEVGGISAPMELTGGLACPIDAGLIELEVASTGTSGAAYTLIINGAGRPGTATAGVSCTLVPVGCIG